MFLSAPLWRCGSADGWITEACLRRQIAQLKAQNERLREVFLKCRKAIMMDPRMKTQERARETLDFLAEGTTAHLCRAVLETEELAKEVEA
jgi:hypothetical protein